MINRDDTGGIHAKQSSLAKPTKPMSKNIYLPLYFKAVTVAFFVSVTLFASVPAWGQEPWSLKQLAVYVRYTLPGSSEGTNDIVIIPNVKKYDGSISTGTWNGISTSKGKRLTNWETGGLSYPATHTVNYTAVGLSLQYTFDVALAVEEFWEYHLYGSGYTKVSGVSLSMNCHGHSTVMGCWLDDFENLIKDDYAPYDYIAALAGGAVFGSDGHSIKIESVVSIQDLYITTSEKYRDSGVYEKVIVQSHFGELQLETTTVNLFADNETSSFSEFYKKN